MYLPIIHARHVTFHTTPLDSTWYVRKNNTPTIITSQKFEICLSQLYNRAYFIMQ